MLFNSTKQRSPIVNQGDSKVCYALDLEKVTKVFKRYSFLNKEQRKGYSSLKSSLLKVFQGGWKPLLEAETQAISDLTLKVPKGLSVGVIGRNGSGKSTLLKLITGIYKPTRGTIRVNGRIAALIELGAGFHPDFTGRENLYLSGIMYGLSKKEVDKRFLDIVSFAELEDVIDEPVRTYSTGMFMRLAFSVAVHTDPDILLIDEVLSVGDESFSGRCREKIKEFQRKGGTLFIVSHDLTAIEQYSNEVLWLEKGVVKDRGEPRRVIDAYRVFIESLEEKRLERDEAHLKQETELVNSNSDNNTGRTSAKAETKRWGSREVEILNVALRDKEGNEKSLFKSNEELTIAITYKINRENLKVKDIVFGVAITYKDGSVIHGTNT
ncbi:MAG: ABC transporter ATP-binding protein, partial [Candidatus Dadabacteria bacterium]